MNKATGPSDDKEKVSDTLGSDNNSPAAAVGEAFVKTGGPQVDAGANPFDTTDNALELPPRLETGTCELEKKARRISFSSLPVDQLQNIRKIQNQLDKSSTTIFLRDFLAREREKNLHFTSLSSFITADESVRRFRAALEKEKNSLTEKLEGQALEINKALLEKKNAEEEIQQLIKTKRELEDKQRFEYILARIRPEAHRRLFDSGEFQRHFLGAKECQAFVMAVDIRRSTELMLKARSPQQFSDFITTLCDELKHIVLGNDGVFDKFTGDGILAFFPDFYSGTDAAYKVIAAADGCHELFQKHYNTYRKSFKSVLTDVGLGIGIDFGAIHLVKIAGALTVVGEPVVYACRLSAAPPDKTYLNQPAFESISESCGSLCSIAETSIDIKHEGKILAYQVHLNGRPYNPKPAAWLAGEEQAS